MNHFRQIAATTALSLLLPALTFAQAAGTRQLADWETPGDREVTRLPMYQSFHPDHRWRQQGLRAQAAGQYASARKFFLRSAAYADKAAQAHYALMLWHGQGGTQDRALAQAWMALAAERQYLKFEALRDQLRSRLDDDEKARADEIRGSLFAEYGDAVAKPRLEVVMQRGLRSRTSSRAGGGTSRVRTFATLDDAVSSIGGGGGGASTRAEITQFWDDQYWQPAQYWDWQDSNWEAPGHRGTVTVKPLLPTADGDPDRPPQAPDPAK